MSVFGRNSKPHGYDAALAELGDSEEPVDQALSRNIQYDHRVNELRESSFDRFVRTAADGNPITAATIRQALEDYLWSRVRTPELPDCLDERLNGHNFVPTDGGPLHVNRIARLVRVLRLTDLTDVFYRSAANRDSIFAGWKEDFDATNDQLKEKLEPGWLLGTSPTPNIGQFIRELCEALNNQRVSDKPYRHHPAWATYWRRLKPYVEKNPTNPEKWLERLGVDGEADDWVALLRYPIRDAGTVVRPTQLDAPNTGIHFPSPPDKPVGRGGCIMQLCDSAEVWSEFIHLQFDWRPEHFVSIMKLQGDIVVDFERQRNSHRELLEKEYPAGPDWLPTK